MNLNQVTLPAQDIAASVAFYQRMGFVQIVDTPDYARFECPVGDATFSIHAGADIAASTGVTVYFESEDVDELCARLREQGFEFLQLPADHNWLWREARLADPAGNILCLYWAGENRRNPPWRL